LRYLIHTLLYSMYFTHISNHSGTYLTWYTTTCTYWLGTASASHSKKQEYGSSVHAHEMREKTSHSFAHTLTHYTAERVLIKNPLQKKGVPGAEE